MTRQEFILFLLSSFLLCIPLSAQTYYYERVSKTENGVTTAVSGDGHFITITKQSCYDSHKDGTITYNTSALIYKGVQNNANKYAGSGYFGESIYLFYNNYRDLTIRVIDENITYHYTRKTPSENTVSAHSAGRHSTDTTMPIITTIPTATMPATTSPSSPSSQPITCSGCHGTGTCTACHGSGILKSTSYYTDNHTIISNCSVCHGSGRCGVCHGKGTL